MVTGVPGSLSVAIAGLECYEGRIRARYTQRKQNPIESKLSVISCQRGRALINKVHLGLLYFRFRFDPGFLTGGPVILEALNVRIRSHASSNTNSPPRR
jgi:hypothetical protein